MVTYGVLCSYLPGVTAAQFQFANCSRNLATVAHVKHESESDDITYTSVLKQYPLMENLANRDTTQPDTNPTPPRPPHAHWIKWICQSDTE